MTTPFVIHTFYFFLNSGDIAYILFWDVTSLFKDAFILVFATNGYRIDVGILTEKKLSSI